MKKIRGTKPRDARIPFRFGLVWDGRINGKREFKVVRKISLVMEECASWRA